MTIEVYRKTKCYWVSNENWKEIFFVVGWEVHPSPSPHPSTTFHPNPSLVLVRSHPCFRPSVQRSSARFDHLLLVTFQYRYFGFPGLVIVQQVLSVPDLKRFRCDSSSVSDTTSKENGRWRTGETLVRERREEKR